MRNRRYLCLLAGVCFFQGTLLSGQVTGGSISGTVRDPSGAAVPEATVTARHLETGFTRSTTSGMQGTYRLPSLLPGAYEVRIEKTGFRTEVSTGLTLSIGQEAVLNATLQVGSVAEVLSVTAEAPLVETTTGSLSGLIEAKQIADLPLNGRNITELALLEPGIAQFKGGQVGSVYGGIVYSSNGAPTRSNVFLLDGTIMNNQIAVGFGSAGGRTLGAEAIREFRLTTNTFSAEFGMGMGSVMQAATRSGGNDFHGSVFEYLRNDNMDARRFFDVGGPPEFKRNQFGFSLGGPIKRDKAFFFGTYEGVREIRGNTQRGTTITADARKDGAFVPQIAVNIKPYLEHYPLPNLPDPGGANGALTRAGLGLVSISVPDRVPENFYLIRSDMNLNESNNLFVRFTSDTGFRNIALNPFGFTSEEKSGNRYLTGEYKHIFSPTMLNSARVSFSHTPSNIVENPPIPKEQWLTSHAPGMGNLSITNGPTGMGGLTQNPFRRDRKLLQTNEDVYLTKGTHGIKFGAMFNRDLWLISNSTGLKGSYTFNSLASFLSGQFTSYSTALPNATPDRNYLFSVYAFYLQDDWRVAPGLTLNLGMRYEFMTTVREVNGLEAALRDIYAGAEFTVGPMWVNPSKKNFSPRLGFAWDVFGDGKTSLRGGGALQYDLATFSGALSVASTGTPPFAARSSISLDQLPPGSVLNFQRDFPVPAGFVASDLRLIDYRLQQPHLMQYNLSVQRQLPGSMAVTLAYSGSRGFNLMQLKEGNPWIPRLDANGNRFWPVTAQARRLNPNWQAIDFRTAGGNSWYNGLQWKVEKRMTHGITFQSAYTFSKTIDETQGQVGVESTLSGAGGGAPRDPHNRKTDRGVAAFDIRHNLRFSTVWSMPLASNATGLAAGLAKGWQLGTIVSMQTGGPLSVTSGSRTSNPMPAGNYPDYAPGKTSKDIGINTRNPNAYLVNDGVFTMPVAGYLGNSGRGRLRGPGLATVDLSLNKNFALPFLGEAGSLQFRGEMFNLLNRANFQDPVRNAFNNAGVAAATLGQINDVQTGAREIQLGLRLTF